jgi:hypothetical protein
MFFVCNAFLLFGIYLFEDFFTKLESWPLGLLLGLLVGALSLLIVSKADLT